MVVKLPFHCDRIESAEPLSSLLFFSLFFHEREISYSLTGSAQDLVGLARPCDDRSSSIGQIQINGGLEEPLLLT